MKHINRNFPWCDEYDDCSFTGFMNERRRWSDEEYFRGEMPNIGYFEYDSAR